MKVGLALSGGAVKGSYEVGCYFAFKKCNIKFNGIVGTSIGAFNAAMLASNKEHQLLKFWQTKDIGKVLGLDPEYVKLYNNKHDLNFYKETIEEVFKILKNKGLSISGLQKVLEELNIEPKLRKSNIDFGLSTFRLDTFSRNDIYLENIPSGKLNDYIIASCYFPVFKQEKLVDGGIYTDGGLYNNCPVNLLVNKKYDKIYAIDLKAVGINQKVDESVDVTYISPSHKISSLFSLSNEDVRTNIKYGYFDTLKVLKSLDGNNFIFKKKDIKYYKRITRHVNELLLNKLYKKYKTNNVKELTIKCMEKYLQDETYFKIYNVRKTIKYIKNKYHNYHDEYIFLTQIKFAL